MHILLKIEAQKQYLKILYYNEVFSVLKDSILFEINVIPFIKYNYTYIKYR